MENRDIKVNTKMKDRLFRLLFGTEEMKGNIISLYNAINNTNYQNPDDFELTTLEDTILLNMKNDVSLLIDSFLTLWEHQSTINPNMPIRGLMYFGKLYNSFLKQQGINIYGSKLVKLPTPQYIAFYNGREDAESIVKLKLSDAFIHPDPSGEFEWTATMYNLNKGHNDDLLTKCKPLADYMAFINYIREYISQGLPAESAVMNAIDKCIKEGVLADFLTR